MADENQPIPTAAQTSRAEFDPPVGTPVASPESRCRTGMNFSALGKGILSLDLLLCLGNLFAFGWMGYQTYVAKDIDYTGYSFFVNAAMVATGFVGIFGSLGNILLLAGSPVGRRFVVYRGAFGVVSVVIAVSLMFMMLPSPTRLMSEKNQTTYLSFLVPSVLYLIWLVVYSLNSYSSKKA